MWVTEGTALFLRAVDGSTDTELDGPSLLPGWTRRHVLAHVAANATAIGRLVTWARTGMPDPMYSSPEQRADEIEHGAQQPVSWLRKEIRRTAAELAPALVDLPDTVVVTARGRHVPATELPWMRAREVCVHAVDLDAGIRFDALPTGFLAALVTEVVDGRTGPALRLTATDTGATWQVTGDGEPVAVELPLARLAGWLTGRETRTDLPELPSWL